MLHLTIAILAAAAAQTAAPVALSRGEGVTLSITSDGDVTVVERGPEQLNDFERRAVEALLQGLGYDVGPNLREFTDRHRLEPPPLPKKRIRIKFVASPDGGSVLFIANGYRKALSYHAVIHGDGRSAATDVCLVTPNLHTNEHWPFPIDRIELSELRLQNWHKGDPIRCE